MESGKTRWNGYTFSFFVLNSTGAFKTPVSAVHTPIKFKTLRFDAQFCAFFNDKEY